jgi:membrane protein DedA with SNARE-associated domain
MGFIQGLHGTVALVLLCSLLFAEEAGVPLPTPGELTLIAAGLLIATGGLDPWLFLPWRSPPAWPARPQATAGPGWWGSTGSAR